MYVYLTNIFFFRCKAQDIVIKHKTLWKYWFLMSIYLENKNNSSDANNKTLIAKISFINFFKSFVFPDERSIVPPGTESSEPRSENTLSNSNTEGKPERTVIPPKRSYNSGPGQGHRGYINPYHQNNYRPSAPKKPFDFSRVGGTCSFLCICEE